MNKKQLAVIYALPTISLVYSACELLDKPKEPPTSSSSTTSSTSSTTTPETTSSTTSSTTTTEPSTTSSTSSYSSSSSSTSSSSSSSTTSTTSTTTIPQGSSQPIIIEDFSTYISTANMISDPRDIYTEGGGEDVNTNLMSLDTSDGVLGSHQSMKYTWPDRTNNPNLCQDFTIRRNIKFKKVLSEVWYEIYTKFSPNFETYVPQCAGVSANGYKYIFGRCHGIGCGRFHIIIGNQNGRNTVIGWPGMKNQGTWGGVVIQNFPWSSYIDGKWHSYRFHLKVGIQGHIQFWFDNILKYDSHNDKYNPVPNNVTATDIYSIALGINMNQGPIQMQTLNWGSIKVWDRDPGW